MVLRIRHKAAPGANTDLTGVQLEPGPVATPFEHRPIGTELALCQRYYQEIAGAQFWGATISTTGNDTRREFSCARGVMMRTDPTETAWGLSGTATLAGSASAWSFSGTSASSAGVGVNALYADAEL